MMRQTHIRNQAYKNYDMRSLNTLQTVTVKLMSLSTYHQPSVIYLDNVSGAVQEEFDTDNNSCDHHGNDNCACHGDDHVFPGNT